MLQISVLSLSHNKLSHGVSSFPDQPPKKPHKPDAPRPFPLAAAAAAAAAASIGIGYGVGLSIYLKSAKQADPRFENSSWIFASPICACPSLADGATGTLVEPKTGVSFPSVLDGNRRLLGVYVRRKSLFGLKNIDVYAFGVYADDNDVKKWSEIYSEVGENKGLIADFLEQDVRMIVRLQIVYGRLSIRSVHSAFEESIGSRLLKLSASDNKELL